MEQKIAVYIINGSSLGGGEMDSILRASMHGGFVLPLQAISVNVRKLCDRMCVQVLEAKDLFHDTHFKNVVIKSSGFFRDLTLSPMLLALAVHKRKLPDLEIGVHCDPLSSPISSTFKIRLATFIYQIFGLIFASRVRFVSVRQLKTFSLLSKLKRHYVDPPCSMITKKYRGTVSVKSGEIANSIAFIGRLSSSAILGDAKNSKFLPELSQALSAMNLTIDIFGGGNQDSVMASLSKLDNVRLNGESLDVEGLLLRTSILVVPSNHEGYCLIAREASLLGSIVLVSPAVAPEIQALPNVVVVREMETTSWIQEIRKHLQ
ncbi:glycosyltransferase [Pseudohalioglobus lutimaris]|uniref:Glycosyl transferase family 1 domain-containing protein n=1 Tax=Pseudohalioglobus lutimaris TaxID=1737061 RepID=A0A2N5X1G6_9GAMM|nr:glycosyltransferase [Pseudohalioglobus lutimaris]PLW68327.1 hypothetical protein C0039_13100 [Pseudohalioglobus lutimaris]